MTTYVCSITNASYGSYSVTANYLGDINYNAVDSNNVTLNISTLVSSLDPTITHSSLSLGGTTTITALVIGQANDVAPAGTMNWTITGPAGAIPCTTVAPAINTSGYAIPTTAYSCSIPTAQAGTYNVSATFPGDSNYKPASNNAFSFSIWNSVLVFRSRN